MRVYDLPEALLELHYFPAFRALLEEHFGRSVLRILKPSQREEVFLGFDQGFAKTAVSGAELRRQLAGAIATSGTSVPTLYVGYFLQYKCVEQMMRRNKALPTTVTTPYYRAELSLEPNRRTGLSQHETLLRLQAVTGADVNYACPMIFSEDDLWQEASVDDVRVVSLTEAPSGWATTRPHHLVFRSLDDAAPLWCSEPVTGKSRSLRAWIESSPRELWTGAATLEWLNRVRSAITHVEAFAGLPASLTLVEFDGIPRRDA